MTRILLLFAGQGYNSPDLLNLFMTHDLSLSYLKELSVAAEFDLIQSAGTINNPKYTQFIIGAYQLTLFRALSTLLSSQHVECAGYSLGEVSAFLASINASPKHCMSVLSFRTQLMTSLLNEQSPNVYDLMSIYGQFNLKKITSLSQEYHCHIAIINSEEQCIIGGQVRDLMRLKERLSSAGLKKATYLSIHLPSHTPFYSSKSGEFYQYLVQLLEKEHLSYPVLNPLELKKIYKIEEEIMLLDKELYSCLKWFKVNQLIMEYKYDLIIDIGPGRILTNLLMEQSLNHGTAKILTVADYKTIQGIIAHVNSALAAI